MSASLRIRDMPEHLRPREKLEAEGADALSHAELIAILLRTGLKGLSAVNVAQQLLNRFEGRLQDLAAASIEQLREIKGIGRDKAVTLKAAFKLAELMAKELRREAPLLDTPERIAELLREQLRFREKEQFQIVLLNTRRRLIDIKVVADGTLDTLLVHPREVFKPAIAANAAAVVLAHNHPSGDPTPSEADIKVTRDLIRAGQLLKIEVLDHVILGQKTRDDGRDFASLRELGYFYS
jgi:DNA repair protein RadC